MIKLSKLNVAELDKRLVDSRKALGKLLKVNRQEELPVYNVGKKGFTIDIEESFDLSSKQMQSLSASKGFPKGVIFDSLEYRDGVNVQVNFKMG